MVRIISICLAVTYNLNHSYTPLQKWIVRLLMTNRSLAHMPRIYKGLIWKNHQFLLHGPHQVGHASAWKIRTPDRILEQRIPAE